MQNPKNQFNVSPWECADILGKFRLQYISDKVRNLLIANRFIVHLVSYDPIYCAGDHDGKRMINCRCTARWPFLAYTLLAR